MDPLQDAGGPRLSEEFRALDARILRKISKAGRVTRWLSATSPKHHRSGINEQCSDLRQYRINPDWWNVTLHHFSDREVFQSPAWFRFVAETQKGKIVTAALRDGRLGASAGSGQGAPGRKRA